MSFLSKLFGKSTKTSEAADLAVLKCDVHSHFIPGIDDGAQTMEDSVALIREFYNLGYKKVITTPHILSDGYKNTPEIILGGLEKVRVALKHENIPIQIEAAAEYYIDFDFDRKLEQEKLLTFGKNYLLFEVSYLNPPDNLETIIFKLQMSGYKPVLAHPERYNFWHNKFEKYESLKEKGVLLQMNINSLTGYYGDETKKISEQLIEKNMIDFLGSDCHRMDHVNLIKGEAVYEKALQKLIESGKLLNSTL
ncbi:MAG: capsular biosynthesis protein [Bacteroidetes bacterium]|nr:capsular biosynthesis protein [Bacteroidota bacterium]